MFQSPRLRASDLHDAARESLDAALAGYGFKPSGGYTEGRKASHLYRGWDRFLIFNLEEGSPHRFRVELGLAADDDSISSDHSMSLEELASLKGAALELRADTAHEFLSQALQALEFLAKGFLDGDLRPYIHDHAEVIRSRGRAEVRSERRAWPRAGMGPHDHAYP